jgi:hypothetical protein
MYDQLLFILGHYRDACDAVWPAGDMLMWGFLFMSDWTRGTIDNMQFLEMMGYVGDDYTAIAQCMIADAAK